MPSLYPQALYAAGGDPPSKTALALMIAGAAVAGAVVWHFTRESYYTYVPPRVSSLSLSGCWLLAAGA
jgi:hypothetical protein